MSQASAKVGGYKCIHLALAHLFSWPTATDDGKSFPKTTRNPIQQKALTAVHGGGCHQSVIDACLIVQSMPAKIVTSMRWEHLSPGHERMSASTCHIVADTSVNPDVGVLLERKSNLRGPRFELCWTSLAGITTGLQNSQQTKGLMLS